MLSLILGNAPLITGTHGMAAQVVDDFSSKSFRLIAVAVGIIQHAPALDFSQMIRQEIESAATHLELLCLVVLTNSIREDSKDTIREVQERCVCVSG